MCIRDSCNALHVSAFHDGSDEAPLCGDRNGHVNAREAAHTSDSSVATSLPVTRRMVSDLGKIYSFSGSLMATRDSMLVY